MAAVARRSLLRLDEHETARRFAVARRDIPFHHLHTLDGIERHHWLPHHPHTVDHERRPLPDPRPVEDAARPGRWDTRVSAVEQGAVTEVAVHAGQQPRDLADGAKREAIKAEARGCVARPRGEVRLLYADRVGANGIGCGLGRERSDEREGENEQKRAQRDQGR